MEKNNRTNPSQAEPHNRPPQRHQNTEPPQEGDIRKVEISEEQAANDDAYEVEQDDVISESESDTEEENNATGNNPGDDVNRSSR